MACGPDYARLHECEACEGARVCVDCRSWAPAPPDALGDVATKMEFLCGECLAPTKCRNCCRTIRRSDLDTHSCGPCFACEKKHLYAATIVPYASIEVSSSKMKDDEDDEPEPEGARVVAKCCTCSVFVCDDPEHSGKVGVTLMGTEHPAAATGARVCKACGTDCRQCGAAFPTSMMEACVSCHATHICPACASVGVTACFDCRHIFVTAAADVATAARVNVSP